jgi:hypothetical protein
MAGIFNARPWRSQLRGNSGGQGRWEGGGGIDGSNLVSVAGGARIWPVKLRRSGGLLGQELEERRKLREGEGDCWPRTADRLDSLP